MAVQTQLDHDPLLSPKSDDRQRTLRVELKEFPTWSSIFVSCKVTFSDTKTALPGGKRPRGKDKTHEEMMQMQGRQSLTPEEKNTGKQYPHQKDSGECQSLQSQHTTKL